MGEPVQQGSGQPFGSESLGPFVERQVAGNQGSSSPSPAPYESTETDGDVPPARFISRGLCFSRSGREAW